MEVTQPDLLVNDYEKTEKWIEDHVRYYHEQSVANSGQKKTDELCWQYFNNKTDVTKFEYLTKMGNFHLPSQIRHIPLQRTNCEFLISSKARRPFVYDVITTDRASMEDKYKLKIQGITDILTNALTRKYHDDMGKISEVDNQLQQLMQTLQVKPETPEQQQQQQMLQQSLPMIQHQFDYMKDMMKLDLSLTDDELDDIKSYKNFSKKEWKEDIALSAAKKLRKVLNVDRESTKNFISDVVVGRGNFLVDLYEGDKYPTFKANNVMKISYPKIDGIDWIQDCPWVKIEESKSYQQICVAYGEEIKKKYGADKLKDLSEAFNINNATFASTPGYGAVLVDELYSGSSYGYTNIRVEKIYFKVPKKIPVKYSPNPYVQGEYYRKFLDGEKVIINKDKYRYKKDTDGEEYYIAKNNEKDIYRVDQVDPYIETKGEKMRTYYMNDIYEGVVINNELYICLGRKKYVLRDPDKYSDVKLPVYGRTHASINDQPYSIIKDTINLQDMYDLVNYYRDLMFALAGPKTILYDRSFKPTNMKDEEWEYQKKLGTLYIQTYDKVTGQRNPSTFNQWSMMDMTLSPSVQYYDLILQSIKETMGEVVGVPRQAKGQVVASDQVGTFEMSLKQTSLVNEIRFDKHDEVEARAFEAAINLYLKYCLKENDLVDVINKDFSMDIKKVTKNVFNDIKIEVLITNNSEQERQMSELKELAMVGLKSGTLGYDGLVKTFVESQNLVEFKNKIEYFTEKTQELQQANLMAAEQQKGDIQAQAIKLGQEFEGFWKQKELEGQQIGQQILAKNNEILGQIQADRNAIEREKLEKESALKMYELATEDKTETNLLSENREARVNQQKLDAMKLQLESIINMMSMEQGEKDLSRKHTHDMKKLDVEMTKAKKMNREHVNDN